MRFLIQCMAAAGLALGAVQNVCAQAAVFSLRSGMPPFLRPGDRIEAPLTIINGSGTERTGQAELQLTDAATGTSVDGWFQNVFPNQYFTASAKDSTGIRFPLEVPHIFFKTAHWRFFARAGNDSAVASGLLPVLPYQPMFTQTALHSGSGKFFFPALKESEGKETLQHALVQVQLAASPAVFAYAALPALLQQNGATISAEADKLFAAALLLQLVRQQPAATTQILSAAAKPAAATSAQQLSDPAFLESQVAAAAARLLDLQQNNGAYPFWLDGPENIGTTQYVVATVGRLKQLGALPQNSAAKLQAAAQKAVRFLKKAKSPIAAVEIAYLESFFAQKGPESKGEIWVTSALGLQSKGVQAMTASMLWRRGEAAPAKRVLELMQQSRTTAAIQETQNIWSHPVTGMGLMLEAAHLAGNNAVADSVTALLLRQKEPQGWSTTAGTTAAVYALLLHNKANLAPVPNAAVQLGKLPPKTTNPNTYLYVANVEAGLVHPALGDITVGEQGTSPLLTLVHWRYFDEPAANREGITLQRQWRWLKNGQNQILTEGAFVALGDTIEVQLDIDATQSQKDLWLLDGYPAGFAPLPVAQNEAGQSSMLQGEEMGQKKWLIAELPAGRTTLVYRMKAEYPGSFTSGAAMLQGMYSSESHARIAAVRINVE